MGDQRNEPLLRVIRGNPTAEELAALTAVLQARATARPPVVSARSSWVRTTRPGITAAGLPVDRGAHAWRASALPG